MERTKQIHKPVKNTAPIKKQKELSSTQNILTDLTDDHGAMSENQNSSVRKTVTVKNARSRPKNFPRDKWIKLSLKPTQENMGKSEDRSQKTVKIKKHNGIMSAIGSIDDFKLPENFGKYLEKDINDILLIENCFTLSDVNDQTKVQEALFKRLAILHALQYLFPNIDATKNNISEKNQYKQIYEAIRIGGESNSKVVHNVVSQRIKSPNQWLSRFVNKKGVKLVWRTPKFIHFYGDLLTIPGKDDMRILCPIFKSCTFNVEPVLQSDEFYLLAKIDLNESPFKDTKLPEIYTKNLGMALQGLLESNEKIKGATLVVRGILSAELLNWFRGTRMLEELSATDRSPIPEVEIIYAIPGFKDVKSKDWTPENKKTVLTITSVDYLFSLKPSRGKYRLKKENRRFHKDICYQLETTLETERVRMVIDEIIIEASGYGLYLMSKLPDIDTNINDDRYENSYIWIECEQKLYYVRENIVEKITINDVNFFKRVVEINEGDKQYLTEEKVKSYITLNGGHTPNRSMMEDKFVERFWKGFKKRLNPYQTLELPNENDLIDDQHLQENLKKRLKRKSLTITSDMKEKARKAIISSNDSKLYGLDWNHIISDADGKKDYGKSDHLLLSNLTPQKLDVYNRYFILNRSPALLTIYSRTGKIRVNAGKAYGSSMLAASWGKLSWLLPLEHAIINMMLIFAQLSIEKPQRDRVCEDIVNTIYDGFNRRAHRLVNIALGGCYFYLRQELPANNDAQIKNAYILIEEDSSLYYRECKKENGRDKFTFYQLQLNSVDIFKSSLKTIMGENENKHLSDREIETLIGANGYHISKRPQSQTNELRKLIFASTNFSSDVTFNSDIFYDFFECLNDKIISKQKSTTSNSNTLFGKLKGNMDVDPVSTEKEIVEKLNGITLYTMSNDVVITFHDIQTLLDNSFAQYVDIVEADSRYKKFELIKSKLGELNHQSMLFFWDVLVQHEDILKFIYVILENDEVRVAPEPLHAKDRPTHSELANGKPIKAGGEFVFRKIKDDWELITVNNGSGHYRPPPISLKVPRAIIPQVLAKTSIIWKNALYCSSLKPDLTIGSLSSFEQLEIKEEDEEASIIDTKKSENDEINWDVTFS